MAETSGGLASGSRMGFGSRREAHGRASEQAGLHSCLIRPRAAARPGGPSLLCGPAARGVWGQDAGGPEREGGEFEACGRGVEAGGGRCPRGRGGPFRAKVGRRVAWELLEPWAQAKPLLVALTV